MRRTKAAIQVGGGTRNRRLEILLSDGEIADIDRLCEYARMPSRAGVLRRGLKDLVAKMNADAKIESRIDD